MAQEPAAPDAAQRLQRWTDRTTPVVIGAALLPLVGAFAEPRNDIVTAVLLIICWLVFVVDLVVRMRLSPHYLRTGWGRADLAIVLLTFPWNLLPVGPAGRVLVLARLARVGRVVVVTAKGAPVLRRMFQRLGKAALYAGIVVLTAAWLVYLAERPNDGFETFGDAVWWAIVTVTTVGYGDIVPTSTAARFAASMLMISGIALIGALAGTLASALGLQEEEEDVTAVAHDGADARPSGPDAELLAEVVTLRREVAELAALVRRSVEPDDV